jgi:hypothetical protein
MKPITMLLSAVFNHATLAVKLKHDGAGMPVEVPAATLLAILFMITSVFSHQQTGEITLDVLLKIVLIAQCYALFLRNQLIGLILLISIICNALAIIFISVGGIPKENLYVLLIAEYIMIGAAILNVFKKSTKVI